MGVSYSPSRIYKCKTDSVGDRGLWRRLEVESTDAMEGRLREGASEYLFVTGLHGDVVQMFNCVVNSDLVLREIW